MQKSAAQAKGDAARLATHEDIEAIVKLVGHYWAFEGLDGFDEHEVAEQLDYLLSDRRLGEVWVCGPAAELTGYLIAVYVFSLEHKGLTAEIDEFFVLPALRGKGLGQSLLGTAESRFRELRCTNVSLQLARENDAARLFYRDRGYADRSGFKLLDKDLGQPSE